MTEVIEPHPKHCLNCGTWTWGNQVLRDENMPEPIIETSSAKEWMLSLGQVGYLYHTRREREVYSVFGVLRSIADGSRVAVETFLVCPYLSRTFNSVGELIREMNFDFKKRGIYDGQAKWADILQEP